MPPALPAARRGAAPAPAAGGHRRGKACAGVASDRCIFDAGLSAARASQQQHVNLLGQVVPDEPPAAAATVEAITAGGCHPPTPRCTPPATPVSSTSGCVPLALDGRGTSSCTSAATWSTPSGTPPAPAGSTSSGSIGSCRRRPPPRGGPRRCHRRPLNFQRRAAPPAPTGSGTPGCCAKLCRASHHWSPPRRGLRRRRRRPLRLQCRAARCRRRPATACSAAPLSAAAGSGRCGKTWPATATLSVGPVAVLLRAHRAVAAVGAHPHVPRRAQPATRAT